MRYCVITAVTALALVAVPLAGAPREKARRIAVLEFQNVTQDKTLDWIGTGMKEELTSQLSQIAEFVVVERARLGDALKELNFNRSQFVDPAAAQKMGKMLGAQSVVVGSYQKFEDTMRIHARLVDVETGEVKSPIRVDGPYKKFLDLESEVAKKLVAEMKGALSESDRKQLETKPTSNLDAHRLFSDGVYFLRNDLVDDAVAQFDKALEADPNYGEAWFYKGLALEKRQRWDDAIAALKRALPSSQATRPVKWSWQVPFEQEKSERGRITLINFEEMFLSGPRLASLRAGVVFGERVGKQTVVHFVGLERRSSERFVFNDPNIVLQSTLSQINGARAVLLSGAMGRPGLAIAALDAGSRRTWLRTLPGQYPPILCKEIVLMLNPASGQWYGIDPETGTERWQRGALDLVNPGVTLGRSAKHGLVIVGHSASTGKLRVIRADTGEDVWSADLPGKSAQFLVGDGVVIALDPAEGLAAAFDLETGAAIPLPAVPAGSDRREGQGMFAILGSFTWVPAILREGVLYFWTKDRTLAALSLKPATKTEARLLWRIPMESPPRGFEWDGEGLYVSTRAGEVFAIETRTGRQRGMVKLAEQNVNLDEVGKGVLLASSAEGVYAVDTASGKKKWEYPNKYGEKEPRYFNGAVLFRTGNRDLTCLDAETGSVLWQHSGAGRPIVHTTAGSLFVSDDDGVKEYSTERPAVAGIADKEVYTELARTLLLKGDLPGAQVYARKVLTDLDPNYAPARLVQARILKAQGDRLGAGRDLSSFLTLEGLESRQAGDVVAELKKDHGLVWHTDAEAPVSIGYQIQGKLISVQGAWGEDLRLYAFDRVTGKVAWKHPGQRLMLSYPDFEHGRVFQLTGRRDNPRILELFAVAVSTGERRKVATLTSPRDVNQVRLTYAAGTAYVAEVRLDVLQTQRMTVQMVAVDAESGKVRWEKSFEQPFGQQFGIWMARGSYLLYSRDKDLYFVSGSDGAVLARHTEPSGIGFLGPYDWEQDAPKDILYCATGAQFLVAFDLAKQQVLWRAKVPGYPGTLIGYMSAIHNGVLYDRDANSVFAVRVAPPADGSTDLTVLWKTDAGPGKTFSDVMMDQGRVFARRNDGVVVELDAATGKMLKEYPLLWEPNSVLVGENRAYVFSTTGRAYALDLAAEKR